MTAAHAAVLGGADRSAPAGAVLGKAVLAGADLGGADRSVPVTAAGGAVFGGAGSVPVTAAGGAVLGGADRSVPVTAAGGAALGGADRSVAVLGGVPVTAAGGAVLGGADRSVPAGGAVLGGADCSVPVTAAGGAFGGAEREESGLPRKRLCTKSQHALAATWVTFGLGAQRQSNICGQLAAAQSHCLRLGEEGAQAPQKDKSVTLR